MNRPLYTCNASFEYKCTVLYRVLEYFSMSECVCRVLRVSNITVVSNSQSQYPQTLKSETTCVDKNRMNVFLMVSFVHNPSYYSMHRTRLVERLLPTPQSTVHLVIIPWSRETFGCSYSCCCFAVEYRPFFLLILADTYEYYTMSSITQCHPRRHHLLDHPSCVWPKAGNGTNVMRN